MDLSRSNIARMFPRAHADVVDALVRVAPEMCARYQITTARRWVHFCGQVSAEPDWSAANPMRESFAYSPARFAAVFGSRVRPDEVAICAAGHDAMAEHVYGMNDPVGRTLGNNEPGDGAKYIGRGLIQTTGKDAYRKVGAELGADLLSHPELLEQPEYAVRGAFADWHQMGVNTVADTDNILAVTKRVNGGTNGLADREAGTARAKAIWGNSMAVDPPIVPDSPVAVPIPTMPVPANENAPPPQDHPLAPAAPPPRPTPHDIMRGGSWRMRLLMWFSRVTGIGSVSAFGLVSAGNISYAQGNLHAVHDFITDPIALYMGCGFLGLAVVSAAGVFFTVRAVERGDHIPAKWLADLDSIAVELGIDDGNGGSMVQS